MLAKHKLKSFYARFRFKLSASNNILIYFYYKYFYTPKDEISKALNDLSNKLNGKVYLIQVGANDGITHDPVHKFIKRDKWRGLLLEPQSHEFNKLQKLYAKDIGVHTIRAALGNKDGKSLLFKIAFSKSRWATGLSSMSKEALLESFKSGHVSRNAEKEGLSIPDDPKDWIETEEVELRSFNSLIAAYECSKLDLLQIDTEGFDFEVIKYFFASKAPRPKLIVFEHSHLSKSDAAKCDNLLTANSYMLRKFGGNSVATQIN